MQVRKENKCALELPCWAGPFVRARALANMKMFPNYVKNVVNWKKIKNFKYVHVFQISKINHGFEKCSEIGKIFPRFGNCLCILEKFTDFNKFMNLKKPS